MFCRVAHSQEVYLVPLLKRGPAALTGQARSDEGFEGAAGLRHCQYTPGRVGCRALLSPSSQVQITAAWPFVFPPLLPGVFCDEVSLGCAYLELMLAEGKMPITYI